MHGSRWETSAKDRGTEYNLTVMFYFFFTQKGI